MTVRTTVTIAEAYVAEYSRLAADVNSYRVVMPEAGQLGIIYVNAATDGSMLATTFFGRLLPEVPAAAREAVTAFLTGSRVPAITDARDGSSVAHHCPEPWERAGVNASGHNIYECAQGHRLIALHLTRGHQCGMECADIQIREG